MNIYADRGNLLLLERRCAVARDRLRGDGRGARRGHRPRRARPLLPRRRPGPRPGAVRAGPGRHQARRAARRGRRRGASSSPSAAATSCSATTTSSATSAIPGVGLVDLHTVREDGPRLIGNVAIEVAPARARRRRASSPASRTTAAARTSAPARSRSGRVLKGHGNTGALGLRGRAPRQRHRHLPPRPAAAQERVVRRLADRHRAGPRASRSRRSTTRSRTPRTPTRAGWRASQGRLISH